VGCFSGAFILRYVAARKFFAVSVAMMLAAMVALFFSSSLVALNVCVALIGFGNSNIFSIIFSQALLSVPEKKNEVSGLMIMGLFGGTIFPLAMGLASDSLGSQNGAVAVMLVGVIYLLLFASKIKKS
jgi:fucose permease